MPIIAKLELTLKINTLPTDVTTDKNGWKRFKVDAGGRIIEIALRPRMWAKIEQASKDWPTWLAAISGQMGRKVGEGFELAEPAVQVFERKVQPPPNFEPPPAPPNPE
jgi:hypothetical protein